MADIHEKGKKGEKIALRYLMNQGYQILETNWQSNHQEIDIICIKERLLVVVEVKARSSSLHGEPQTFVTKQKQKMLIKAANHYVMAHKLDAEVRFDIITILFCADGHELNHIEDAFYPMLF